MRSAGYLLVAGLLLPHPAAAQSRKVEDIPPGPDRIIPLKEGAVVPYEGLLFDPPTALRWGNWLKQYKLRLAEDVELQRKIGEADVRATERRMQLQIDLASQEANAQRQRATELEKRLLDPPWYRTVWFGATLGVVGAAGLTLLGAYLTR
ncbi:MAG TPA: hypothetical protein PKW90_26200 [Myxococcota bacterium]|nr:hypothetical protein [Myxococcota bacterium]